MAGEEKQFNNLSALPEEASLDKRTFREKLLGGAIVIVAFFAVIFGYYQLSRVVNGPLINLAGEQDNNALAAEILAVLELQQADTDGDGLSDYDEINIYGTSRFLADTDSDGFSDKEEIDGGYDPNCPGNENCFRSDQTIDSAVSDDFDGINHQALLTGGSSPAELRQLLRRGGFPQETLDAISDEDLLLVYQQVVAGQDYAAPPTGSGSATGSTTTSVLDLSGLNITSIDDLRNLSGYQIRQLLIQEGAPTEMLSQVSDEDLKAMFLSQLEEQAN